MRKVEKQVLHWMSFACSLTFSWDLASPLAFLRLRSRFCAALAPCICVCQHMKEEVFLPGARARGVYLRRTYVAATHLEGVWGLFGGSMLVVRGETGRLQ